MSSSAPISGEVSSDYATDLLRAAESVCRARLNDDGHDAGALHLRGMLASRNKQHDFAVACLALAADGAQDKALYLTDLGDALVLAGRHAEALSAYLQAIRGRPDTPESYCRLGRTLVGLGHLSEAVAMYGRGLTLSPSTATIQADLGDVLCRLGRLTEAIDQYQASLQLDPTNSETYGRLGRAHLARRDWHQALACFRQGVTVAPPLADLHVGVGESLLQGGLFQEAADAFQAALLVTPGHAEACRLLVCALELLGRTRETAAAWHCLGAALESHLQHAEAATAYDQALTRKPDSLRTLIRLGWIELALAQPQDAVHHFRRALAIEPNHRWTHIGLGQALHLTGDLIRGWDELSWYLRDDDKLRFEQPMWDGSALEGRRILLWADQLLGDTLQLLRYVPLVTALGGRVTLECHHIILPLVERTPGVERTVAKDRPLPPFDLHAPLSLLPRFLRTDLDTIPGAVPYVAAAEAAIARWAPKLDAPGDIRVGLVWSGEPKRDNATTRFMPLARLGSLAGLTGVRFFSLQVGAPAQELLAPPPGLDVTPLLDRFSTIDDTAAVVSQLDLVITVDTMTAHLAGALARPVWTLLPYAADWRWHAQGDRSPWYPTMRLFRQARMGDWSAPVASVRVELERLQSHRTVPPCATSGSPPIVR